jgi:hypothetical protein
MVKVIEAFNEIQPSTPYFSLLQQRWSLAGTTKITLIEQAQDYLRLHAQSSPFDGIVHDVEHKVFIAIAVSSNSGVRETIIPESLVLSGDLSFLQEAL